MFDRASQKLLGALPFPEGDVFVLKFSPDGRMLLAAGGVGAESGKAVVFDTKTWARSSTLGDELDAVLAADLSADAARVVVGGPNRVVKVLANPGGKVLHTFRKPTDWVTSAAFSPDGLLVAAGDRFGGLFLWETRTGQEFLALRGHAKAVNAIAWNASADTLITAGEDGAIQVWDLHTGKVSSRWDAHAGGVLAVDVHRSGRVASAGRDRRIKVWEPNGQAVADLGPTSDQATRLSWTADARTLVSGDWSGEVRLWTLSDSSSTRLPMPVAARPARLALVAPVLTPARPYTPKTGAPTPASSLADRTEAPDSLESALASAREAAASAERTVASLSRLVQSRARSSAKSATTETEDALSAANAALTSLRTALASDPGNTALTRAIEETGRAVRLLEQKRDRITSLRVPATSDR
jgi:WD40 repeat protein